MIQRIFWAAIFLVVTTCSAQNAPGAPGVRPSWTNANKAGLGTSTTLQSKVWFTIGGGALNEVYYPTVDTANTRTLELIVSDGHSFAEHESTATDSQVQMPDPAALTFHQVNIARNGAYRITKTYITDPGRNSMLVQVTVAALHPAVLRAYVFFDPAIANSGAHDTGYGQHGALIAHKPGIASALLSSVGFVATSSGYAGVSDGVSELQQSLHLTHHYARARNGNVAQIGELPAVTGSLTFTLALGFGSTPEEALNSARASLADGFEKLLEQYRAGWHHYVAGLRQPDRQYQLQYQVSAMVLKAHEDKTYPGAVVASLTIPWGNEADASGSGIGGYHLVWARDLYEAATAFWAMGDHAAAVRALTYLFKVQQKPDGSFPQNSWLDGRPYWKSLQMDEVAFPLIMAYQFGQAQRDTYEKHVKPAAEFLLGHGPATPQERWEESAGYSPSTLAAEIAGLVCAAELARRNGDRASAERWLATADSWARQVDAWTVTTRGPLSDQYFIRIAPRGDPNRGEIQIANGGGVWDERQIVDAGFLELVRLGIRRPDDPAVLKSLAVVDKVLRVETPRGVSFYRYNHDGYGEHADGKGYDGTGIGRLWILLTGERGEYLVASGGVAGSYLDTMQNMAGPGHMLAEQVWDRRETPDPSRFRFGEATGSANPLAWTNAQFIRLALAVHDRRLPETPDIVLEHFRGK